MDILWAAAVALLEGGLPLPGIIQTRAGRKKTHPSLITLLIMVVIIIR